MKKIITTVGTSIFTNYFNEKENTQIKNFYNLISDKPYQEWGNFESKISKIKKEVLTWAKDDAKENASAEIKSILKLKEEKENDQGLEIYLLSTDTISSALAAEIIKDFFKENTKISVYFDPEKDVILNLQVDNFEKFESGKDNLISRISQLINDFVNDEKVDNRKKRKFIRKNIIFNITGGYKGVIPILTILAQLYEIEIFYIFESSNDAIFIPRIPINFDPFLTEALYIDIYLKKKNRSHTFRNKDKLKEYGFIDREGNITALGGVFYEMAYSYSSLSPNVLGYFVEYKILEYLHNKNEEFKHSYNQPFNMELDFYFEDKKEVWEIKSLGMFLSRNNREKVLNQFRKQLSTLSEITSYCVVIYSITDSIKEELKNIVSEISQKLKDEFPNVNIKFKFLQLRNMSINNQDNNANPYQALFKYSVKDEHFCDLFSEE